MPILGLAEVAAELGQYLLSPRSPEPNESVLRTGCLTVCGSFFYMRRSPRTLKCEVQPVKHDREDASEASARRRP